MEVSDVISTSDINETYVFLQTLGQYKSFSYLYRGAFAEVKKAAFKEDGSIFAVKIIEKRKVNSADLKIFMNQCKILLNLEHPNIIQIYEVFDNLNFLYIVMEYCEGGQLYAPKNLHRCKNQSQISQIVLTITDALDFLHSKNIVHRDIKPENVLWSTNDEEAVLKIADFGTAKVVGEDKLMTTACGTPMFFSPEILEGQNYSFSVDFWSLGIITYILLSGRAPFEAEDDHKLFQKIINSRIQFPERQWKYISYSAKDFIIRMLQKNPNKRYKADKVRNHPWINAMQSQDLLYRERGENLKQYSTIRKVEKAKFMIQQTINQINRAIEDGSFSMIAEEEEDKL